MRTSTVHCGTFGNRFDFSPEALKRALKGLPGTSFRKSVLRYQSPRQQWMSLLSRQLLLKGLSKLDEELDESSTWSTSSNGRPYIDFLPDFNISHSGKIAVCAIGTNGERVGIDIQIQRPVRDRHIQQVFTNKEITWVAGKQDRAACLWSRKEAVTKLLGLGMKADFRELETLNSQVNFQGKTYHLANIPVAAGYQCTLAGERPLSIRLDQYYWCSTTNLEKQSTTTYN